MKCLKYYFLSPLYGYIQCYALLGYKDNQRDLDPTAMLKLYNKHTELGNFLLNNMEDLSEYVPESLKQSVIKAEFGNVCMHDNQLFLMTEVTIRGIFRLSTEQEVQLREWITGQLSDGWGESLEQTSFLEQCIYWPEVSYDEDECRFVDESEECTAKFFCTPWVYDKDWSLRLFDTEIQELSTAEVIKLQLKEIVQGETDNDKLLAKISIIEEYLKELKERVQ